MGIYIEDSERPGTDANGMRESEKETCKETYKAANHTHIETFLSITRPLQSSKKNLESSKSDKLNHTWSSTYSSTCAGRIPQERPTKEQNNSKIKKYLVLDVLKHLRWPDFAHVVPAQRVLGLGFRI